ncbi:MULTISPECIES: hypothetical protein [Paenibacillus]|uniref:Uncharacterized protein n=1 Tax=Paenibacillus tianjinensis TaxID=2810347 RepID=A0ABX7L8J5_9BACL|nr:MULTISPECIES: hypothetical protein [Paenibacillus]QSF43606.1 hypothetical protein JRJ22_20315 [Paenibacillus tianjinensis]
MFDNQNKVWSTLILFIILGLLVYGGATEIFIPSGASLEIKVFNMNFTGEFPHIYTSINTDLTVLHGIQNGVALTGKIIWSGLKSVWADYIQGFQEGLKLKIVWLILGIPLEIIKNFFKYFILFFLMIINLFVFGGNNYQIALAVSALILPALAVALYTMYPSKSKDIRQEW